MFIIDWIEENLDFDGVGPAAAMLAVVGCIVALFIFGN